jgi:hypothetical protein
MTVVISSKHMCHKKNVIYHLVWQNKAKTFHKKLYCKWPNEKNWRQIILKSVQLQALPDFSTWKIFCLKKKNISNQKIKFVILQKKTVSKISWKFILQNQMTKRIHVRKLLRIYIWPQSSSGTLLQSHGKKFFLESTVSKQSNVSKRDCISHLV